MDFFTFFFDDDIATFFCPIFLTIWLIHLTTNLDLRIIHCLALHRSLECTTEKKIKKINFHSKILKTRTKKKNKNKLGLKKSELKIVKK